MKWKVFLLLALGLGVGLGLGALIVLRFLPPAAAAPQRNLPPSVGAEAADFSLTTLDGKTIHLSDYKGRPVVLNFWATWCPPCKEEMPLIERYAQTYGDQLVVLGIDHAESQGVVQDYVDQMGIHFPILLDQDTQVSQRYFVHSFPATFFVDADGVVRAQHLGLLSEDLLVRYLETVGIKP